MITTFPRIFKGETIHSILSKYHIMMNHIHYRSTLRNLYSGQSLDFVGISIDLPSKVSGIHQSTLHFKIKEHEKKWVYDHTAYAYYTYFTNQEARRKILKGILNSTKSGIILASGKGAFRVKDFSNLRICFECFKQDRENTGVASWYLIHQMPGVFICPFHNQILRESSLYRKTKILEVPTLENCKMQEETISISLSTRKLLSQISNLTEKILFPNKLPSMDLKLIKEGYIGLLKQAGYGSYHSFLFQKEIINDIRDFYGNELFHILIETHNFSIDSLRKLWSSNDKVQHPIYHIILINFLYEKLHVDREKVHIEELINRGQNFYLKNYNIEEAKKKVVCLNRLCNEYKQTTYCEVSHKIYKRPVLQVNCKKCGFSYRLSDLPQDYYDYKYDAIIDVGTLLKERILKMHYYEHLSLYKIAEILKISEYSIKKTFHLCENKVINPLNLKFHSKKDKAEWTEILTNNPNKTKSHLISEHTALYKRLYRHEKMWVMSRTYKKKLKKNGLDKVDWKERDLEVIMKLREAYGTLLKRYPTVRITKNLLVVEANLSWNKRYD